MAFIAFVACGVYGVRRCLSRPEMIMAVLLAWGYISSIWSVQSVEPVPFMWSGGYQYSWVLGKSPTSDIPPRPPLPKGGWEEFTVMNYPSASCGVVHSWGNANRTPGRSRRDSLWLEIGVSRRFRSGESLQDQSQLVSGLRAVFLPVCPLDDWEPSYSGLL